MVIRRIWAVALCSLLLVSCSDQESKTPAEELSEGAPAVSATDSAAIADAPEVSIQEAGGELVRLRVKQGDHFRYSIEQNSRSDEDSVTVNTKGGYVYSLRVKNVRSDGSVEFGMTFEQVRMDVIVKKVNSGQTVVETHFNSKDSADRANPQNQQFVALIDEEATVLLSSSGALQEVSGLTPIVNKIMASAPPQQRDNPQVKEQIKNQLQTAMYASFISQQMVPYPDEPLGSSNTWSKEQTSPVFGGAFQVNSKTAYTITGIREVNDHHIAEVSAELNGTLKLGPPPPNANTKLTLNRSKITGSSKARLDITTGMTVSKENRALMDVMATGVDPRSGKSQSLAQLQETTFKLTLLR